MKRNLAAAVVAGAACLAAGPVSSQTSVIQQNSVSGSQEGASVTISGQTVTVETSTRASGRVVGDGQVASETRPIGPVAALSADGAFALTVKQGPSPQLTIETDKNLLPIVKTDFSNGRLDVYTDRSYSVDGRIKVTVTSPDISEIAASGSNDIVAEGMAADTLAIVLNGSNNATLAGRVSALKAQMNGSNRLAARSLTVDSAKITMNGSGNAAVNTSQQITAEISGAGAISVYGNPKARTSRVNGAGKITFVE